MSSFLPHFGRTVLLDIRFLVDRFFFSFSTFHIWAHCLLAVEVSDETSADNLTGDPLYVTSCFSLAAFKSLSLSLAFNSLIITCLGVGLFSSCYLEIFELLECLYSYLSSNLGRF